MKSNRFRKVFSAIFILIYLLTAPGMLVTPARAEAVQVGTFDQLQTELKKSGTVEVKLTNDIVSTADVTNNTTALTIDGGGNGWSGNNGGTRYNGLSIGSGRSLTVNNAGTFSGFKSEAIIAHAGTVTVNGGVTFRDIKNNSTDDGGGAVSSYAGGNFTINASGKNVTFENNEAKTSGGAVRNYHSGSGSTFNINGADIVTFSGNSAPVGSGGAISGENEGTVSISADEIKFMNNTAGGTGGSGGAVYNQNANLSIVAGNVQFSGNTITNAAEYKRGGGAFYQRAGGGTRTVTIGKENGTVTFENNKSNKIGGAIGATVDGGAISNITINGAATFRGNSANMSGGGIWNNASGSGTSTITFTDTATFTDNKAGYDFEGQVIAASTEKGGAIDNYGTIVFDKGVTATGNMAAGEGGAIYNEAGGAITFKGTSEFSDNSANNSGTPVANDIYNKGTLNFASGSVTNFSGGIAGTNAVTVGSGATVNFLQGAKNDVAFTNSGTMTATGTTFNNTITVDGGTLTLHGTDAINASGTGSRVKALMVNNGGSVTNSEGDTLTITATNNSTASDTRADGVVLWNESSANPGTNANLYGVTGITATGVSAHGVDVADNGSVATIRGNGTAAITSHATGAESVIGEAYAVQPMYGGNLTLEGFKDISARSDNGYARTLNVYTGTLTLNDVETISAYGGLTPVDPEAVSQYGLAYAVQSSGGDIDINGNNTEITAITAGSNSVGIGVSAQSNNVGVVYADGIASITSRANGPSGSYSYASGIGVQGVYDPAGKHSQLYLNREEGSPYADITVIAPSTNAYGIEASNGTILEANINNVSVTSGATAEGVYNWPGTINLNLNGSLTATATGTSYGVFQGGGSSAATTTITGTNSEATKKIEAKSTNGNAYAIYNYSNTSDTITINNVNSISACSSTGNANAIYGYSGTTNINDVASISATANNVGFAIYGIGGTTTVNNASSISASGNTAAYSVAALNNSVVNINGKDAEHKTNMTGIVDAEDGGTINLKNVAITGDVAETKYSTANYGNIKFLGTNTVDGAVTLQGNESVTAAADSYSLTQVGTHETDTITVNGGVSVSGAGSYIDIAGTSTAKAAITGTATAAAGSTLNLSNATVGNTLTNNGTATLENVSTTEGWTLSAGSVTNTNSLTNGTDFSAMSKTGTVNGDVYASSGTLDMRGVDLRLKGDPLLHGGTVENPTTLDTLKATRVLFGDIYDGSNNLTIKNIVLENCTTEYRAALGVYYDTLTVDNISVNAPEGWYWDQQYNPYNYQMYTGFGGTLNVSNSMTAGEIMNAGYSVGGTGIMNFADGAVINCVDFQNTGNMDGSTAVTDEQTAANIAAGIVHVNGAGATLNAASLNNHAITTLGTVNLTSHSRLTTPSEQVYSVNYGTDAELTIGQLNFLNKQGDTTKNQMRFGDNAKTIIGGLTTNPAVGADFYVTQESDMSINKDGGNAVKYTGDIVFTTYGNAASDKTKVSMNLDSSDDYFTGAVKGTVTSTNRWGKWGSGVVGGETASTDHIKGMTLNVSNGATWNVTSDSYVNNLTVDGGNVLGGNDKTVTIADNGTLSSNATVATNVTNEGTVTVADNATISSTLTNKGKLNLSDANHTVGTTLNVGSFTGVAGGSIDFDADISGSNQLTDHLTVTTAATGDIALGSVNIKSDADTSGNKTLALFENAGSADFSGLTISGTSTTVTSSGKRYDFTQDTTSAATRGNLTATEQEPTTATLADIVQNQTIEGYPMGKVATFSMTGDYTTERDLGKLTRVDASAPNSSGGSTARTFTINGNNNNLSGAGHSGITVVNSGDTLVLKDLASFGGFNGNAVTNAGTLAVSNSTVGNSIANSGTMTATDTTINSNIDVNGGSLTLHGTDKINASGSEALYVHNGGKVSNTEGDSLSIKVTNSSATTKAIVLDNTATDDVNLFGVSDIISTGGNQAYGIYVNSGSKATIRGNGESTLAAYATDGRAHTIYASYDNGANNDITLEGFKEIIGDSTNSHTRTLNLYGGNMTINGVEKISAYGGKADVDPESSDEAGLAYAITAQPDNNTNVNLDLNGNNTQITATSKASSAAGISALVYKSAGQSAVMHADGIAEITAQTNGQEGKYVYANGLDIYGGELYLNRETGTGANISVTASNSYAWGALVYGDGKIEANIKNITANSVYAYGIQNDGGRMDVNLTGDVTVNATKDGNAVVARDGSTTITGTGTNAIAAHTTTGDAVAVYADGGSTELNGIGSISATSDGANAYSVYTTAAGTTLNISGQSADNKTALTGKVVTEDGAALNLKNVAITGDVEETKTETNPYGNITFYGANTVDGAVTLHNNQSVTTAAGSYSLTQTGTDAMTFGGNLAVSGAGSTVELIGSKEGRATITGAATVDTGAKFNATNTTFNQGLTSTGANAVATLYDATLAGGTYTAKSDGKIVMESGTLDAKTKTLASYFGDGHQDGGFVLSGSSLLDTNSNQVFTNALTVKGTDSNSTYISKNPDSGAVTASQIDFRGGNVHINDEYYTLDYATTAKAALDSRSDGETNLKMLGTLVTAEGDDRTIVDAVDKTQQQEATVQQLDDKTALTLNGSLLVGDPTNSVLTTEGAVDQIASVTQSEQSPDGIIIRDTSTTSINVDKLNLAQRATGVVITNDKYVTLGGASGREGVAPSDVIEVETKEVADVDVVVGLDKTTADMIGVKQEGTLNIGNSLATGTSKYLLSGNVTVNDTFGTNSNSSDINVTGKAEISKNLVLSGADVNISSGSKLEVGGTTTVKEAATGQATTISGGGTLNGDTLVNDGKLIADADALQYTTIENNSVHTLVLGDGTLAADITTTAGDGRGAVEIDGDVSATGKTIKNQDVTVNAGKTLTLNGVNSDNTGYANAGTINLNTKESSLGNGITGAGVTNVNVNTTLTGETKIEQKNINIAAGTTLSATRGNLGATDATDGIKVASTGTLKLGNGNVKGKVTGEGNTVVEGFSFVDGTIATETNVKGGLASQDKTALGYNNRLAGTATNSVAIGNNNNVSGNKATAVGYGNVVSGNNSGAFGDPNYVTGAGSYAIGNNNNISGDNTFVLGNGVTTTANNSVALGKGSTIGGDNEVSVGSSSQTRKITNVTAGDLSATSTDVVVGSQLNATNQKVATNTADIATINASAPMTSGITAAKVGSYDTHVANGDIHVTAADKTKWNGYETSFTTGTLASTGNLSVGGASNFTGAATFEGAATFNNGASMNNQKITNVANGTDATDAATYGQVKGAYNKADYDASTKKLTLTAIDGSTRELKIEGSGVDTSAVHYDDASKDTITLQGTSGSTKITKLASAGDITDAANETNAVNAGDLKTETRVTSAGNYIATANTAAANIKALDDAMGKQTTAGNYIAANDATHTLASNIDALDKAIGAKQSGDYIGTDKTVNENLKALDSKIGTVASTTNGVAQANTVGQNIDALNSTLGNQSALTSTNYVASGKTVAENLSAIDEGLGARVTDGNYVLNTNAVNANIKALDDAMGKQTTAGNYIAANDATHTLASNIDALDKAIGAKQSGDYIGTDKTVNENLKALDSKIGTVTSTTNGVAQTNTVGQNIDALNSKLGDYSTAAGTYTTTGTVAGDVKALDSKIGTVASTTNGVAQANTVGQNIDALNSTLGNQSALTSTNYVASGKTVAENLAAIDEGLGARVSGAYISNTESVNKNLYTLDQKLKDTVDKGYTFGDGVNSSAVSLGKKVDITGSTNIATTFSTDGSGNATIEVALKDDVTVKNVTATDTITAGTTANKVVLKDDSVKVGSSELTSTQLKVAETTVSSAGVTTNAVTAGTGANQVVLDNNGVKVGTNTTITSGNIALGSDVTLDSANGLAVGTGYSFDKTNGLQVGSGTTLNNSQLTVGTSSLTGTELNVNGSTLNASQLKVGDNTLTTTALTVGTADATKAVVKDGLISVGKNANLSSDKLTVGTSTLTTDTLSVAGTTVNASGIETKDITASGNITATGEVKGKTVVATDSATIGTGTDKVQIASGNIDATGTITAGTTANKVVLKDDSVKVGSSELTSTQLKVAETTVSSAGVTTNAVTAGTGANQVVLDNNGVKVGTGTAVTDGNITIGTDYSFDKTNGLQVGSGTTLNNSQLQIAGGSTLNASQLTIGEASLNSSTLKVGTSTLKDNELKVAGTTVNASGIETKDITASGNITATGEVKGKTVVATDSVTVGNSSLTTDTLKVNNESYITAAGINANNHKVTNVAEGAISATSKDAVTGSQLNEVIVGGTEIATGTRVNAADARATVKAGTKGATAVGYNSYVSGERSTAVGYGNSVSGNGSGAFGNDNTVAGNNNFVLGSNVKVDAAVENSVALGNNSTVTESNTVSVGAAGAERTISNVKAVTPTEGGTYAATTGQLYDESVRAQTVEQNLQSQVNDNRTELREVGAMSAALAGLHYVEPTGEGDDKFTGAVSYGGYRGASAAAVGLAYKPSPNLMVSASTSVGNSNNAYNAGISYKFGKGETAATRAGLQKQVKYVNEENKKLKEENEQMKETLKSVLERLEKLEKKQ